MKVLKSIFRIRFCATMLLTLNLLFLHAGTTLSADITLAWDANSEGDLAGYKIHYLTVSPNGPLDGTGLVQGESPITVPLGALKTATSPSFHLSGLAAGESYHFSVTAYNKTRVESDFSNLVRYDVPVPDTYNLSASTSGQGNISPTGGATVPEGSSKTFVITADMNHHITDVIVDGKAMGPIGSYTFDNIRTPHAIQAIFARDTYSVSTIISGNSTSTPEKPLERDGDSIGTEPEPMFPDIGANHLSEESVEENINAFYMEVGEVNVNNNWQRVTYSRPFVHPVVVASALSNNDDEPAVVRIDNITNTGFEICVQEWDYLDDDHLDETIGYLVMESGRYTLPNGTAVEAGTFTADTTEGRYPFRSVAFTGTFTQAPVIMSSVASYNGPNAVTTRLRNITLTRFECRIKEQQANRDGHLAETVSYIAWEPCQIELDGLMVEVANTDAVITHVFRTIPFFEKYPAVPVFVGAIQTADGVDTATLRWTDRSMSGIQVKVEEEQSFDQETAHLPEVVGYFAFVPNTSASTD